MKKVFQILLFFTCINSFAQKNWLYISTDYQPESTALKEVIPVVNNDKDFLAVFFKEKKTISGSEYDKDHVAINKPLEKVKLPKKARIYIGSSVIKDEYVLFFNNQSKSKFASLKVNFKTGSHTINEDLGIDLNEEYFLSYFNKNNKLYLLTMAKYTSLLTLYTIDFNGSVKQQSFDCASYNFETSKGKAINLYKLLTGNSAKISAIDAKEPSSIEIASADTKLFFEDGKIEIVSDRNQNKTYIINLNIENSEVNISEFVNERFGDGKGNLETNAFIYKDYYFRIYSTYNRLGFFVYDKNTKEQLKSYYVSKNDSITFKNTPIINENEIKADKETEDTNKFLREITNSDLGVSVHEVNNNYVVTIGGSREIAHQGPGIPIASFASGAVGVTLSVSFTAYTTTKSTYIKCLFDEDFNHLKGEIPLNGFDKINEFIRKSGISMMSHQTVFKYTDNYVWGSYSKSSGSYGFLIFE